MTERLFRQLLSAPATFRYFDEVARAGSFRKAGEALRIAPSAVHRQITMLEERLGTRLFDRQRGRQGVKLTAAGEVLKLRAGQAIELLSRAADEITALSDVQRGRVSFGVNDTLATDVVSDFIGDYSSKAPRLDFNVRVDESPDLADAVVGGSLDAMLCFGAPVRLGLRTLWERRLQTVVVVRPDHPLARRQELTLAECAQYPLAMQKDSDWTRGFAERAFREGGFRPRMLLQTNSFSLMRRVVASGLAISIQTHLPGITAPGHEELKYIPIKGQIDHFSVLTCCAAAERRLPPASHAFVEQLISYLDQKIPGVDAVD
jgi:DNA-binding transcriptional LysR family regulator